MVSAIRRNPSKTSGFTLVELLVVITIIGILMGLLIPAVQAARETARRAQCSSQINNLAKATIQHEMAKRQYPGWINLYGNFTGTFDPSDPNGAAATAHVKVGTWVVDLLPYLDGQPTYEIWTQDKYPLVAGGSQFTTNAAPNLAIMQCPSSTTLESNKGRNSYVSNNGMHPAGSNVDFEGSMSRANGVFNAKWGPATGPAVRADDLKDGLSTTVLFSENLQAQPWHQLAAGNEATAVAALTAPDAVVSRFPQGFVWHYRDASPHGMPAATPPTRELMINGAPEGSDIYRLVMISTGSDTNAVPDDSFHSPRRRSGSAGRRRSRRSPRVWPAIESMARLGSGQQLDESPTG